MDARLNPEALHMWPSKMFNLPYCYGDIDIFLVSVVDILHIHLVSEEAVWTLADEEEDFNKVLQDKHKPKYPQQCSTEVLKEYKVYIEFITQNNLKSIMRSPFSWAPSPSGVMKR